MRRGETRRPLPWRSGSRRCPSTRTARTRLGCSNSCVGSSASSPRPVRCPERVRMDPYVEVCTRLEAAGVRYLVVGAFGINLYAGQVGVVITTADCDLMIPADPK